MVVSFFFGRQRAQQPDSDNNVAVQGESHTQTASNPNTPKTKEPVHTLKSHIPKYPKRLKPQPLNPNTPLGHGVGEFLVVRAAYAPKVSKGPCVSKKPCTRWEFLRGFGVSRIMRIHGLQNNVGPKVFISLRVHAPK